MRPKQCIIYSFEYSFKIYFFRRKIHFKKMLMHKNAIKLEILWVGGKYYQKKGPKLANFPRFWAKNLANLAINWTKIGDF